MANKNVNMSFRIDEDLRDNFTAVARSRGYTAGKLLRRYMEKYVLVYGDKANESSEMEIDNDKKFVTTTLRIEPELNQRWQKVMEEEGRAGAVVIREFMASYVKAKEAEKALKKMK